MPNPNEIAAADPGETRELEREYGVLHVFAQYAHHTDAYIVGTSQDLLALRNTLDQAMSRADAQMVAFASDGEGYDLHVVQIDQDQAQRLLTAYTADYAEDSRETALHPWHILRDRYARAENAEPLPVLPVAQPDNVLAQPAQPEKSSATGTESSLLDALKRIAAIENKMFGLDWEEIDEARRIAREAVHLATGISLPVVE